MKLSIITINRNNAMGLERTMRSVRGQISQQYEHIIVDGASTDGSAEMISQYAESAPYAVKWVSESDGGIYNAMNKGARMACGDYLLFLNSGDALAADDVIEKALDVFSEDSSSGTMFIGRVNVVNADGSIQRDVEMKQKEITLFSLYLYGIPHQACFIPRTLMMQYPYDESLKINADWKFFLETIVMQGTSYRHVPLTVSDYDGTGISSVNTDLLLQEREQAFRNVIPVGIAKDYMKVFPHYYETYRVEWLLRHPFFYKVYRAWATLGMKFQR